MLCQATIMKLKVLAFLSWKKTEVMKQVARCQWIKKSSFCDEILWRFFNNVGFPNFLYLQTAKNITRLIELLNMVDKMSMNCFSERDLSLFFICFGYETRSHCVCLIVCSKEGNHVWSNQACGGYIIFFCWFHSIDTFL